MQKRRMPSKSIQLQPTLNVKISRIWCNTLTQLYRHREFNTYKLTLKINTLNVTIFEKFQQLVKMMGAVKELDALRRIRKYLTLDKTKLFGNAFIDNQFNYAPLIWMFCHETTHLKMQKIHHKTLKVIYQPDASTTIQQQRVPSPTTFTVFIGGNIKECWYLEPPVYVVILQIQRSSIQLETVSSIFHSTRKVYNLCY